MSKKNSFKIVILFSIFFAACSNNQTLKVSYQDTETLKDILKEKEAETKWVQELEGEVLTRNIEVDSKIISKEVSKDNQTLKILKDYQKPVYPQIEDFGGLDSTVLSKTQKKFVNEFINQISTNYTDSVSEIFVSGYAFNYQFFLRELKEIWKDTFNEELPEISDENKIALFTNWIIGQPLKNENQILIPVRVYLKKSYLNLLLSTTNDVSLKLYNVQIEKVGENNGNR